MSNNIFQSGTKNISDLNVPLSLNFTNSNQKEKKKLSDNTLLSKENIIIKINEDIVLKDNLKNVNLSSKNLKKSEEEKNSSTNNIGDEMTVPLVINNFNDDNNAPDKTANQNNEEDNNKLNLVNNGQNRLGTVLETINEVSNSKVDSSELSDDDEEENNNANKDNDKINKSLENDINNKKESASEHKKDDSDKNTLHIVQ